MVGKRFFLVLIFLFLCSSILLTGCTPAKSDQISIGIIQLVEHPALDEAREGFLKSLESKGLKEGENIEVEFQNAQGDIPTTQIIARNFASENKDMILAIATPSAQSAFNVTKEIPIVITAVTDPVEAGLVKSLEKAGTNVTGTSDATPVKKQLELLKTLIPNAKKVGVLYNTSEINGEVQVKNVKEVAKEFDLEVVVQGVNNINEVSQSIDVLLNQVDVLYTITDNTVASSMPIISKKCLEKNIPIIGGERAHVEGGALATEGIDYYKLGYQTGLMAVKVLEGKSPKDMSIETLKDTSLVINEEVAKTLNITIPKELMDKAEFIQGGK